MPGNIVKWQNGTFTRFQGGISICVYLSKYIEARKKDIKSCSIIILLTPLRQGLSQNMELSQQSSSFRDSPVSSTSALLGLQVHVEPHLYVIAGDVNSGPHVCKTKLFAEPPLQGIKLVFDSATIWLCTYFHKCKLAKICFTNILK